MRGLNRSSGPGGDGGITSFFQAAALRQVRFNPAMAGEHIGRTKYL